MGAVRGVRQGSVLDPHAGVLVVGAEALPSRDDGFDLVVSGLVQNFFTDPGGAGASVLEGLRPGGTVAAYVWEHSRKMGFLRFFRDEAVAPDPAAAAIGEGWRFPLCGPSALASPFPRPLLTGLPATALETSAPFASCHDCWTPFLPGTRPAPSYVAWLDAARRAFLRERLRLHEGKEGPIALQARAWVDLL